MNISRRNLLKTAGGILVAAPFVAGAGVLMPVKKLVMPVHDDRYRVNTITYNKDGTCSVLAVNKLNHQISFMCNKNKAAGLWIGDVVTVGMVSNV